MPHHKLVFTCYRNIETFHNLHSKKHIFQFVYPKVSAKASNKDALQDSYIYTLHLITKFQCKQVPVPLKRMADLRFIHGSKHF